MLKWFSGKFNSTNESASTIAHIKKLPAAKGFFIPLTADELLCLGDRKRALQQLWENSPFSRTVYEALWLAPVKALALRVQHLPASQNGQYAREGGLIDEALDIAVCAVRLSRGWMLPPGAAPEEQAAQSSAWTTAIFYAALLHDLVALNGMMTFYEDGTRWHSGLTIPSASWRVRFSQNTDGAIEHSAMLSYRLLPEEGLAWLSRWPHIVKNLNVYLSGNKAHGDILHAAVSEARQKFGLQPSVLNKTPNIAQVTQINSDFLHQTELVKVNNEAAIRQRDDVGPAEHSQHIVSSVPFEIVPDSYNSALTKDSGVAVMSMVSAIDQELPDADKEFVEAAVEPSPVELLSLLDKFSGVKIEAPPLLDNLSANPSEIGSRPESFTEHGASDNSVDTAGESFWNWLVPAIVRGELTVNTAESLIHVMTQYVFVKSPECFFRYITEKNKGAGEKDEIQKSFESLNLHFSRNGKGIYIYRKYESESRDGRYSKISGYMLPITLIFTQGAMPPDSPWLSPNK